MKVFGMTDIGLSRKINQDTFLTEKIKNVTLAFVCDGMGGPGGGEIASETAKESFLKKFAAAYSESDSSQAIKHKIMTIFNEINKEIIHRSFESELLAGMGTTIVGFVTDGSRALFFNIGDSRAYLVREDTINQITKDHSVVQRLMDEGKIDRSEMKNHPQKNIITRALGAYEFIEPDFYELDLKKGDFILLCSDGLTNEVDEHEILFEITTGGSPEKTVQQLIDIANGRGGADNITAVLMCI
ncbi:MAG: Stp1/IreP family PP2C-type Ser/Thr phosphatase [Bacillota bacterium]|nr:Stp1/IreP family PP2C-type Ser/Thr phosphatase [Bacillota bacterium]